MPAPRVGRWPYAPGLSKTLLSRDKNSRWIWQTAALGTLIRVGAFSRQSFLTIGGVHDGGGRQVLRALHAQAFCEDFGIQYAHTPFSEMAHTPEADQMEKWQRVFNLGEGYPLAANIDHPTYDLADYIRRPALWRRPCIVRARKLHHYFYRNPTAFDLIRERAIGRFRPSVGRPDLPEGVIFAAVHIRRGDVSETRSKGRYTPNVVVLRAINQVREMAGGRRLAIHVFSEGEEGDFSDFLAPDVTLRLNGDPVDALCQMAVADVLVVAISAFSFLAGFYNKMATVFHESPAEIARSSWLPIA